MLVKEAGFTLQDIRGTSSRTVETKPRTGFMARIRRWCPYLEDPEPIQTVSITDQPGMDEEEVLRFLIYHDEMEEIKQENQEDSMREARRKNGNIGEQSTPSYTPSATTGVTQNHTKRP